MSKPQSSPQPYGKECSLGAAEKNVVATRVGVGRVTVHPAALPFWPFLQP